MDNGDKTILITRKFIQSHPDWLFIFGDNVLKTGYGGQAKECRNEPNTFGIPTKFAPSMNERDFFTDDFFEAIKIIYDDIFEYMAESKIDKYKNVVIFPRIGEGLAELPKRAPKIYAYLKEKLRALESFLKSVNKLGLVSQTM